MGGSDQRRRDLHGNEHRDFKIAGKLGSLEGVQVGVIGPDGRKTDLVPDLVDLGYAPKEGFWSTRRISSTPLTMLPHWSDPPICSTQPYFRSSSRKSTDCISM